MRKILTLAVLLVGGGLAQAQYDPKAEAILDEMSAKYKNMTAFKAEFTHSLENDAENISEQFQGEIVVKGDMYRLKLSGQEFYNNGKTIWTYLPEVNEVNIDNYYPEEEELSPSKIFTAYKKGYKYLFVEEMSENGQTYQIIDVVPENAQKNPIYKVRFKIDKDSKLIKSWEMFDKSGSHYVYTITEFQPNITVKDTYLEFNANNHQGVEVVDLR